MADKKAIDREYLLNQFKGYNTAKIGDLKDLKTQNKDNLVEAINEATESGGQGALTYTRAEYEALTEKPEEGTHVVITDDGIGIGGSGNPIKVDSALSTTSENPVQNKVVTTEINKKGKVGYYLEWESGFNSISKAEWLQCSSVLIEVSQYYDGVVNCTMFAPISVMFPKTGTKVIKLAYSNNDYYKLGLSVVDGKPQITDMDSSTHDISQTIKIYFIN